MNIFDKEYKFNGNYLCTWISQKKYARKAYAGDPKFITQEMRNVLNDKMLFSGDDYPFHFIPKEMRKSVILLLDDGWDVPFNVHPRNDLNLFGRVILDEQKFAGYGDTPVDAYKTLVKKVEALGYAGVGFWISPKMYNETSSATLEEAREYWTERAKWCNEAGIRYWKVDWGNHDKSYEYRKMMTECVKEYAPGLYIEHTVICWPLGGTVFPEQEEAKTNAKIFEISDFFRTYDVVEPYYDVTTLNRVDILLSNADKSKFIKGVKGAINVENSTPVAVGLGFNLGIMDDEIDTKVAVKWQTVCPPTSIFETDYIKSEDRLKDYLFGDAKITDWANHPHELYEITAPAISARGTKLPVVEKMDEPPFVMAYSHPQTKAYAVSTISRVIDPNPKVIRLANVTIFPEELTSTIGVFGHYKTLTIEFNENIPAGAKLFAQYILADEAEDITSEVKIEDNKIIIDGILLRKLGYGKTSHVGDEDPSLALKLITE